MVTDSPRILVVEDDVAQAGLLRETLEFEGYQVLVEHDGRRASEAIEEARPDLVLLDLAMPEMNGFEVCKWVREREADLGHLPILVMTAMTSRLTEMFSQSYGADDILRKPFRLVDLQAKVHALLADSRPSEGA
jgi:DNA-binding response OmpR family regulator